MKNPFWYVDEVGTAVDSRKISALEFRGLTPHPEFGNGFLSSYRAFVEGRGPVTLLLRDPNELLDLVRRGPGEEVDE